MGPTFVWTSAKEAAPGGKPGTQTCCATAGTPAATAGAPTPAGGGTEAAMVCAGGLWLIFGIGQVSKAAFYISGVNFEANV